MQIIGDTRTLWSRESDFTGWMIGNLDRLAACLSIGRLDCTGREFVIGERWITPTFRGHERTVGGMRVDLAARDEQARLVIVEAQFGPADHRHLGQLITYASTCQAAVAVWVVADPDPVFAADHLAALAELNDAFAGRREFCVVVATVESQPSPAPPTWDVRLRRIDLHTQTFID